LNPNRSSYERSEHFGQNQQLKKFINAYTRPKLMDIRIVMTLLLLLLLLHAADGNDYNSHMIMHLYREVLFLTTILVAEVKHSIGFACVCLRA